MSNIRVRYLSSNGTVLHAVITDGPDAGSQITVDTERADSLYFLEEPLWENATLNLIDTEEKKGVVIPDMVVLEPDYLIDITALCACIRPFGTTPYNHILNKFKQRTNTAPIELGNICNQFLDDIMNQTATYEESLKKSFHQKALTLSVISQVDAKFFQECKRQYNNVVQARDSHFYRNFIHTEEGVFLEPAFICEALGLQGRMDMLSYDYRHIIELKSGKCDEYPQLRPKEEHAMQAALYREILHYCLDIPRESISSDLFYAHYPITFTPRSDRGYIRKAIALRNGMVALERCIREGGCKAIMDSLNESSFNIRNLQSRFYQQYLRPQILQPLSVLQRMKERECAYFYRFLRFLSKEQELSKQAFAQCWRCTEEEKAEEGSIVSHLRMQPIRNEEGVVCHLHAVMEKSSEEMLCNFRPGDGVMLYEQNKTSDTIIHKQYFRAQIEKMYTDSFLLRLNYPQHGNDIFRQECLYAMEPSYSDMAFHVAYSGLYGFLNASKDMRDLYLGQRLPEKGAVSPLHFDYKDESIKQLLSKVKQARDFFLLIGPPGTGKTNVALKSMVAEFLEDTPKKNILLTAYTNRAVDEICSMLDGLGLTQHYIRIGQELSVDNTHRGRLLQSVIEHCSNRNEVRNALAPIRIVTGTLSSLSNAGDLFELKHFDVALVDEASQILEPQMLPLITALQNVAHGTTPATIIYIGDHKQLPAVVQQSMKESKIDDPCLNAIGLTDCRCSLFERLHTWICQQGIADDFSSMLNRQGRMHPDICNYVSKEFYDNKLDIVPLPHQVCTLNFNLIPTGKWTECLASQRMNVIDVTPDEAEQQHCIKSNCREAKVVAELLADIQALYKANGKEVDLSEKVGVIVPFRAQIALIRYHMQLLGIKESNSITIDTVERYQGSQRDIILYSTIVSSPAMLSLLSEPVETGGKRIDRKLNVALSRAREQFILIGNASLLKSCEAYQSLISYIENHGKPSC